MNDTFFGGRKLSDFTEEELLKINEPGALWLNAETGEYFSQSSDDAGKPDWKKVDYDESINKRVIDVV